MKYRLFVRLAANDIATLPSDTLTGLVEYLYALVPDLNPVPEYSTLRAHFFAVDRDVQILSEATNRIIFAGDNMLANDAADGFEAYMDRRIENVSEEEVLSFARAVFPEALWQ